MEDEEILAMLEDALSAGIIEIPACNCIVELDGTCQHGNESPMLTMELI